MAAGSNRSECLREDTLLAMVDGALAPADRKAIEEHLGTCQACLQLLAAVSSPSGVTPPANNATVAESATSGLLSRYHVTGPIGSGGMGIVYAGWDPELGRPVALKLLRFELSARPDSRARVLREAQAMARLKHPNVVAIYDVGTWNERVFIAMELVEGGTLRKWMAAQPRSWQEIVEIYLSAGRGLAAAHAAGLVHRDFKPDNVLVGRDGRVLVTDFGLARLLEPQTTPVPPDLNMTSASSSFAPAQPLESIDGSQAAKPAPQTPATPRAGMSPNTLTPMGGLVGTPAYMAPEQMAGGRADSRSDLFAFCTAFYESLAGHRPYPGDELAAMRKRAESGVLEPPKQKIPRWLEKELARGLKPAPAQRHNSIDELLHAIEKRVHPNRARRVATYAVAALVLVALLTAGFFAADRSGLLQKLRRQTPHQRRVTALVAHAEEERKLHGRAAALAAYEAADEEARNDPRIALGLAETLLQLTSNTRANEQLTVAHLHRDELLPEERTELDILRAQTQGKVADTLESRRAQWAKSPGDVGRGLEYARQLGYSHRLAEELAVLDQLHRLPPPAGTDPRIDLQEAEAANYSGDHPRALAAARRALAGFQASDDRVSMAIARMREAWALQRIGSDPALARRTLEQGLALARDAHDQAEVASMDLNLGQLEKAAGDYAGARAAFEESRAFFAATGGQVNEASATLNIAGLLRRQGDIPGALEKTTEAHRIYFEAGDRRDAVLAQLDLGELRGDLGDLSGASAAYTEAMVSIRKAKDRPTLREALLDLGELRMEQGDLPAAHQALDEARGISEGLNKQAAVEVVMLENQLDAGEEKFAEAEKSARQLVTMTADASLFELEAEALAQLAEALLEEGRLPEARAALSRGSELAEKVNSIDARLQLAVLNGRLLAKEFPNDLSRAQAALDTVLTQTARGGTAITRLDARLARARLIPDKEAQRAALDQVAQEARAQGFLLYAKAAEAALAK